MTRKRHGRRGVSALRSRHAPSNRPRHPASRPGPSGGLRAGGRRQRHHRVRRHDVQLSQRGDERVDRSQRGAHGGRPLARVRARPAAAERRGPADHRDRLAGLRAVVRRQRPDQRAGLRVGGRLRGRRDSSASARTRWSGSRCGFNQSYKPGDKDFDFDINQISITPGAGEGRGLLRRLLLRQPGRDRAQGVAGRRRHHGGRAGRLQPRRPDRHHLTDRDPRRGPTGQRPGRLRGHQRRQAGAAQRSGRRDHRRPPDRLLHHRGGDPPGDDHRAVRAATRASRSSSGCCSRRATRWWPASTRPSPR